MKVSSTEYSAVTPKTKKLKLDLFHKENEKLKKGEKTNVKSMSKKNSIKLLMKKMK